jgi:peptidoglycan hydrolase-like protein with peptidoglycan-binding domain
MKKLITLFAVVALLSSVAPAFAQVGYGGGGGGGGSATILGGGGGGGSNPNPNPSPSQPQGPVLGSGNASTGGQVLGANIFVFTKNLRVGSKNNDVMQLQIVLKAMGLFNTDPTGYFGPITRASVVAYQKSHGVVPASGYFGPLTRASLNALLAK